MKKISKRKKWGIALFSISFIYLIYFISRLFYTINYELARTNQTILTYDFTNFIFYSQFLISGSLLFLALILLFLSTFFLITDARQKVFVKILFDYILKIRKNFKSIFKFVFESLLFIIQVGCSSLLFLLIIGWKQLYEKVNIPLLISILLVAILSSSLIKRFLKKFDSNHLAGI